MSELSKEAVIPSDTSEGQRVQQEILDSLESANSDQSVVFEGEKLVCQRGSQDADITHGRSVF